jgi:chromosome segregation ATPase
MKTQKINSQAALIIVAAAALILSGTIIYTNRSLKDQLNKEKIKSESLLSEKLNLEKSINQFKKDVASLQGKNARLDNVLKETSDRLAGKESEIRKLMAENASIGELRNKNTELEKLREKLEEQITSLNLNLDQLMAENKRYNDQLASVQSENELLTTHNALLEAMLADNYRIEALKGRHDKLTISARRTNRLMVSFDIPDEVSKELYFKILTPDEQELSSIKDESAMISFYNIENNLLASTTGSAIANQALKRAELIYKPEQKLIKGIYRFNVYNGAEYVGSIQLRLK